MPPSTYYAVLLALVLGAGCASDEHMRERRYYEWPDGSIRHNKLPEEGSPEWYRLKYGPQPPEPPRPQGGERGSAHH
jgi:hypothetical protein